MARSASFWSSPGLSLSLVLWPLQPELSQQENRYAGSDFSPQDLCPFTHVPSVCAAHLPQPQNSGRVNDADCRCPRVQDGSLLGEEAGVYPIGDRANETGSQDTYARSLKGEAQLAK